MEANLEILGNESSVIYYNLNKQYDTIRKLIITNNIVIENIENNSLKETLSSLKDLSITDYLEEIKNLKQSEKFEFQIKNELYKRIQEGLIKISETAMDIKLKDYNFMSSVSNTKFNVTIRCESFSITHYYQEKGALISSIRSLLKEYILSPMNSFRTNILQTFQIEIYETEDIFKCILLKKEGSSLILASSFGFMQHIPYDYMLGSEFYFSIGEKFQFYENSQTHAILRDHTKLAKKEINIQEKVLSNDDLIKINDQTKNIDDALIEIYLNKKGVVKIVNISLLENSVYNNSENGFVINKSSNIFDRISLSTLRDHTDDCPNPKYLLIRNDSELEELFQNLSQIQNYDGIILNTNFYSGMLDKIGTFLDIDIIFYKKPLQKSLDVRLDRENLNIEPSYSSDLAYNNKVANPFSNILEDTHEKEKDEFLERLKNVDLSTPVHRNNANESMQIGGIAQGLISSPNSSNYLRGENTMKWPNSNQNSNQKKSAISMLADSVINNNMQPQNQNKNTQLKNLPHQQEHRHNQMSLNNITETKHQQPSHHENNRDFFDFTEDDEDNSISTFNSNKPTFPNNDYENSNSYKNSSFLENNITHENLKHPSSENINYFQNTSSSLLSQNQHNIITQSSELQNNNNNNNFNSSFNSEDNSYKNQNQDISRFNNVTSIKIITPPSYPAEYQFADINTIGQISGGEIYFLSHSIENMTNPNLKYILPISMSNEQTKDCSYLINNTEEFFLAQKTAKYFINITKTNESIKKHYIKECINKFGKISIMINKNDIHYIEEYINKISEVYITDILNDTDYNNAKNKILSYEKNFLINNL